MSSLQIADLKAEAINVVVRCRGRNDKEIAVKSDIVVDVPDKSGSKEISINNSDDNSIVGKMSSCKTYTVDQVFGPGADQELVFNQVASPLFDDFVKGFNCTIFAYGQTGTGKTYTMCGEDRVVNNSYSPDAGIIPRILFKLFQTLEATSKDYVIKCSLVEIYNEGLKDLLNPKSKKELKIYEEQIKTVPGKPDKSAVFIKGLEEVCVSDPVEALHILRKGLIDRKTSSTNMNKTSSRSHTIFSISLYRKDGDDTYRFSKMNLVDLAGSENISRSGATDLQAKEAGIINKSLLSLGKVINALVDDNLPPYRDSKLTRLLKDSLGGETKTVLIANISPSALDSEETSKTLEYASKAKNVMNTPQVGSAMLKHVVVKDLVEEVTKLRRDLSACWSKDGVMLNKDNYEHLKKDAAHYKIQVDETSRKLEFQQNQNKILNHDLSAKMGETAQLKEKLKELQQVNNILSGKVQKQQHSERMLYDSTRKYKELVALFEAGLNQLESHQQRLSTFMGDEIHGSLKTQMQQLMRAAESSLGNDLDLKENSAKIQNAVNSMMDKFQDEAFEICDSTTKSLTSKLPQYFDELKKTVGKLNNLTKNELQSLEQTTESLERNNAKFDTYLSQRLFCNHEELLQRHIDAINAQNEQQKKEFLSGFKHLFDTHYSKTAMEMPAQISNLRTQIVDAERDLLSAEKFDWLKTHEAKIHDTHTLMKKLRNKIDENTDSISDKVDHMRGVTTNSNVVLEEERKRIEKTMSQMRSNDFVSKEIATMDSKMTQFQDQTRGTADSIVAVAENLQALNDQVEGHARKTVELSQREKMQGLLQTLEGNERIIDSQVSAPTRSRTTSPIRPQHIASSATTTPRRLITKPSSVSRQRSAPGSRTSSRANSRSGSPVRTNRPPKDTDNDKENVLKRKSDPTSVQDLKRTRQIPRLAFKPVLNARKPFR